MTSLQNNHDTNAASDESAGLRLLLIALAGTVLFHGGLLPFTHGNTYDSFIHMFFADSYHRSWFDTWEPRWYTGFSTTSYPPGTHMTIAALMHVLPLRAAFVIVQLVGLLLLTVGVFRFSLMWVAPRPSGYAAILLVLSSSVSETVHLFGQLPTIFSLGIFLNGLPYVYRWIVCGRISNLSLAVLFSCATTAAHHVTTIFGGVLFIVPLGVQALYAVATTSMKMRMPPSTRIQVLLGPLARGLILAVLMFAAIVFTVFPYWYWSITDPITQVPIPHGSRENFIQRPDLGFIFFILPWGVSLAFLPYVAYKGATTRMWPLALSVLVCFILGTGGTTPISKAILRGAFDVLTLDRFTFWGSILALPFLGVLTDGLLHGRSRSILRDVLSAGVHRIIVGGIFISLVVTAVFVAILPTIQPTQPKFVDPDPILKFLAEDNHDHWRYLTLGFGDQFAYLSARTDALSIDGNYHSARRLPDLTRFSVERLENAKYLGVPGLGSLQQFLVNADHYALKYVFSNDAFYDPLLFFTGWSRLNRLSNGVTIWEKPDVTPLSPFLPRREIPPIHSILWGVVPPATLFLALVSFLITATIRNFGSLDELPRPLASSPPTYVNIAQARQLVTCLALVWSLTAVGSGLFAIKTIRKPWPAEKVIETYFNDLDFRRFEDAYSRLDSETRPDFETVKFNWRWRGGLVASYGKLLDVRIQNLHNNGKLADWRVELDWLTALKIETEELVIRTINRDGQPYIAPTSLRPIQAPLRLQRQLEVAWNVAGRRQPRPETDLHRDRMDRPKVSLEFARLVQRNGRHSLVAGLSNLDPDPAIVMVLGDLMADQKVLAAHSVGQVFGQRLLPAEMTGLRLDFEGVLSLDAEAKRGGFDPKVFIPPILQEPPTSARLRARALVVGQDLYRNVALNGVKVSMSDGHPVFGGLAVNTGTQPATIVRIVSLLYDDGGNPIWAEAHFVDSNMYPGQSAPFHFDLPAREEILVLSELGPDDIIVNGSSALSPDNSAKNDAGLIPLFGIPGYSAIHLHVSTMTYDPLF